MKDKKFACKKCGQLVTATEHHALADCTLYEATIWKAWKATPKEQASGKYCRYCGHHISNHTPTQTLGGKPDGRYNNIVNRSRWASEDFINIFCAQTSNQKEQTVKKCKCGHELERHNPNCLGNIKGSCDCNGFQPCEVVPTERKVKCPEWQTCSCLPCEHDHKHEWGELLTRCEEDKIDGCPACVSIKPAQAKNPYRLTEYADSLEDGYENLKHLCWQEGFEACRASIKTPIFKDGVNEPSP